MSPVMRNNTGDSVLDCAKCDAAIWPFQRYALEHGRVVCEWCALGIEPEPVAFPE